MYLKLVLLITYYIANNINVNKRKDNKMKNYLTTTMNFKKLPYGKSYHRDNVLVILSKTNTENRTFIIEEPNIAKHSISNFDEIYLIVEEMETGCYMLFDNDDIKKLTNLYLTNKIGVKRWICKYNLVPKINDDVTQTVITTNKHFPNQLVTSVLLDKADVECIISDNFLSNV